MANRSNQPRRTHEELPLSWKERLVWVIVVEIKEHCRWDCRGDHFPRHGAEWNWAALPACGFASAKPNDLRSDYDANAELEALCCRPISDGCARERGPLTPWVEPGI